MSKAKVKEIPLKQSIKNINFDFIVNDICDSTIIYDKLTTLYSSLRRFVINCSYLYNEIAHDKTMPAFRDFIMKNKEQMKIYEPYMKTLGEKLFMPGTPNYDLLVNELVSVYKLFCKNPVVEAMMYSYRVLASKIKDNNTWIQENKTLLKPFLDCDIDIFVIYNANKAATNKYIPLIFASTKEFYECYILPNFDIDKCIDSIGEYLNKIHKTGQVKCDLIPGYMRKVYKAGLYDIKELNLAYIETENKNVFVTQLMESMLGANSEDLKPDPATSLQIKGFLSYVKKKNNDPKLAATLAAGKAILNNT